MSFNDDYNSKIIKFDLFILSFSINYTINALFFNDNTIHKIYDDHGSFNINYQLPQILYSSLISLFLNALLKMLGLSSNIIIKLKRKKEININEKNNLYDKLKIKFIIFFMIGIIFSLVFWFYLSLFGAIYRNTQLHLIKDTLLSFGFSLFYPFVIYLFPGMFRIPSLSDSKNKKKYLYNLSKLLQML